MRGRVGVRVGVGVRVRVRVRVAAPSRKCAASVASLAAKNVGTPW